MGILLACVGSTGVYAQERSDPGLESKIVASERVWRLEACKAKDLNTLDEALDDAFASVDQDGKLMTKADILLAHVLLNVRTSNSLEYVIDAMAVRLHGDAAIVTGLYPMKGVAGGKPFGPRPFRGYLRTRGKSMRVVALLYILMGASSKWGAGQKPDEAGTAAAIRALEHEWIVGQWCIDNRSLDLIFDNALVYMEYCKLVTKGEYLLRIKQEGPQLNQIVVEPMTVRAFGNTAIVVGTYREKERKGGRRKL